MGLNASVLLRVKSPLRKGKERIGAVWLSSSSNNGELDRKNSTEAIRDDL